MGRRRAHELVILGGAILAAALFACGLEDGGVLVGEGPDGSAARADGGSDGAPPIGDDGGRTDLDGGTDAPTDDDGGSGRHFVFANTSSDVYLFDTDSHVLKKVGSPAGCGIPAGFDTFDLARASDGGLDLLTWKRTGSFSLYGIVDDGGCVDLHKGPGTNPAGHDMWAGFQLGAADTLVAVVADQTTLYTYDSNGGFIAAPTGVLPGGGASGDVACNDTACFTALAHDRCPTDTAGNDCLYTFAKDGSAKSQVGNFGKTGVAGIAYDRGSIFGFCTDGTVVQIATTAPSTGQIVNVIGTVTSSLVWAGAASASGAP